MELVNWETRFKLTSKPLLSTPAWGWSGGKSTIGRDGKDTEKPEDPLHLLHLTQDSWRLALGRSVIGNTILPGAPPPVSHTSCPTCQQILLTLPSKSLSTLIPPQKLHQPLPSLAFLTWISATNFLPSIFPASALHPSACKVRSLHLCSNPSWQALLPQPATVPRAFYPSSPSLSPRLPSPLLHLRHSPHLLPPAPRAHPTRPFLASFRCQLLSGPPFSSQLPGTASLLSCLIHPGARITI